MAIKSDKDAITELAWIVQDLIAANLLTLGQTDASMLMGRINDITKYTDGDARVGKRRTTCHNCNGRRWLIPLSVDEAGIPCPRCNPDGLAKGYT